MKYYFDIRNGTIVVDDEGLELLDASAAIQEARNALASMAPDTITSGENQVSIDVRDGECVICTVTLAIKMHKS